MTPPQFREAIEALGLTQEKAAMLVGASPRTARKWVLGEARVPGSVAVLLRLLLARPELLPLVAGTPPPVRSRKSTRR